MAVTRISDDPTAPTDPSVGWPTPRAAYIHVPFCRHRCGYCNFSVLVGRDADYSNRYLDALAVELSTLETPRTVDSLFIGGGTPTHLGPQWIERLLTLVRHWFPLAPGAEFSVEANPSDVSADRLRVLRGGGVNRVSLGVQSFRAAKLKHLERDHSGAIAERAVHAVAEQIGNVSLDLIFAAPHESPEQWSADLQQALALPIDHLSTYGLTYEKGTRFWARLGRGDLARAGEEDELRMYQTAIAATRAAGLEHYEISNFARPGRRCLHNLAYWEGRGWFAAGPSAARFVEGRREVNHRSPTTYIRRMLEGAQAAAESDLIDRETWARERVAFGLRMIDGVDIDLIRQETGFDIVRHCGDAIDRMVASGLLARHGSTLALTTQGIYLSDSVISEFL